MNQLVGSRRKGRLCDLVGGVGNLKRGIVNIQRYSDNGMPTSVDSAHHFVEENAYSVVANPEPAVIPRFALTVSVTTFPTRMLLCNLYVARDNLSSCSG